MAPPAEKLAIQTLIAMVRSAIVAEHVGDQRQGRRRQRCPGDAEQRAADDQRFRRRRKGGEQRG
ncbi:MAG: hypothetical protein NVV63_11680 [Opitutus sp.]|nr:hypothetical protein [Opitutus sp.]